MPVKQTCKYCEMLFETYPAEIKKGGGKFCGQDHYHKWISENKIRSGKNSNLWKDAKVEVFCNYCGISKLRYKSQIKWRGSRFCSRDCKAMWYSEHKSGKNSWHWIDKVNCNCLVCGKEFEEDQSNIKRGYGKYCSHKCKGVAHTGENNPMFGKIITEYTRKKQSDAHKGKQKGERNPNWNGGITPLYHVIRSSPQMDEWRKQVFKKDNYKDRFTGETGRIVAHHNISFISIIKKYNINSLEDAINCGALWDINNGTTLLESNHQKHHSSNPKSKCGAR